RHAILQRGRTVKEKNISPARDARQGDTLSEVSNQIGKFAHRGNSLEPVEKPRQAPGGGKRLAATENHRARKALLIEGRMDGELHTSNLRVIQLSKLIGDLVLIAF